MGERKVKNFCGWDIQSTNCSMVLSKKQGLGSSGRKHEGRMGTAVGRKETDRKRMEGGTRSNRNVKVCMKLP